MISDTSLLDLIITLVRDLGEQHDLSLPDALDGATVLLGRQGLLDSLGLVSLVVAIEQSIEARHGVTLSLADERAFSRQASPFRTIGSLTEYVVERLGEAD